MGCPEGFEPSNVDSQSSVFPTKLWTPCMYRYPSYSPYYDDITTSGDPVGAGRRYFLFLIPSWS